MAEMIPSGTVTFLFTDVEGSTRLWAADSALMSASLLQHDEILRTAIESRAGYVFTTAGDSFAAAFGRASDAVAAAQAAQAALGAAEWSGPPLRVRMGLHLGEAEERGGDYFGPVVNTAARVEAAGHGGQVLMTDVVHLACGASGVDLGEHQLRDVGEPVRLFQVGSGEFAALRTASSAPESNLPTAPSRLIGRSQEVANICGLLGENRLVTLAAVGGAGKTRLALEVGQRELANRADGVWFVDLTRVLNGDEVVTAVAATVRLVLSGGGPTAQVVEYLRDKQLLIVLDNCEHVIDECAELVEEILRSNGEAVVLATSREALDIDGEQVVKIGSLSSTSGEAGGVSAAVQLFTERAQSIDPDFILDAETEPVVETLCERLDGMALAIELAAARVRVMTVSELLAGLDDRFNLLSGGRRRQRERTLEATLDWSYNLLEPDDQAAFRSLGVVVGSCDIDAAAAVVGCSTLEAVDVVEALVAKSLVVRIAEAGVSRFRLLETVKAYAEDRLIQTEEATIVRDRHGTYFYGLATVYGRSLLPDAVLGVQLQPDAPNLAGAFDWFCTAGRWIEAGELLLGGLSAFVDHGQASEARQMASQVIEAVEEIDSHLADSLRVGILQAYVFLDDWAGFSELVNELTSSGDPAMRAAGHMNKAFLSALVDVATAESHLDLARQILGVETDAAGHGDAAEDPTDARAYGSFVPFMQGILFGYQGDYESASAAFETAIGPFVGNGTVPSAMTTLLRTFALCHLLNGSDVETARKVLAPFRSLPQLYGSMHEVDAMCALVVGDLDSFRGHVQLHVREALTGRIPRQSNDSVLLFAALARAEGEEQLARSLLLHMGVGRSPGTIMWGRQLARDLGAPDEYAEMELGDAMAGVGSRAGVHRSMKLASDEAARRGWLS